MLSISSFPKISNIPFLASLELTFTRYSSFGFCFVWNAPLSAPVMGFYIYLSMTMPEKSQSFILSGMIWNEAH